MKVDLNEDQLRILACKHYKTAVDMLSNDGCFSIEDLLKIIKSAMTELNTAERFISLYLQEGGEQ